MASILVDTGPLVALFDASEQAHNAVVQALANLTRTDRLFTSLAVVTEVTHLLDFSVRKQLEFLQWVELGALTIEPITPQDFPALRTLMQRYTNLPMDFADATLVLLAERLGSQKILTLDRRDFTVYRTAVPMRRLTVKLSRASVSGIGWSDWLSQG